MRRSWLPWAIAAVLLAALILTIAMSARALRPQSATPTVDLAAVQTQAVATFAGGLTSTAAAVPSSTPTERPQPPTEAAAVGTEGTASVSPTPSCYRLKYVRDVTIPDNTNMAPAEVFTKTWQVENSGTCAWEPGFQVVLIGGTAMGGSPFRVAQKLGPGGSIQVSIKMVAPPNQTGVVQGTWKMSDTNGLQFGDYLSVVIVV